MSHVTREPVFAICEQQRCRSACASAKSDQRLCFRCLDSVIPLVSISEISSLSLASLAAQAGLCLTWSQTPKTGFLGTRLLWFCRFYYGAFHVESCLGLCSRVFSPFNTVITRLGMRELVHVLLVHLLVYFARVDFCPVSLPLGVSGWLRLGIVALPGLFY